MSVIGNEGRSNTRSWNAGAQSGFTRPHVALALMPDMIPGMSSLSQPVAVLLGTIPSLRFVTLADLQALADTTQREWVEAGHSIIRQGERGDDVFFIVEGEFDVMISHFGEEPDFIRTLRAGDSFGELGVLYDVPRTATVRCTTTGQVLRIPGEAFLEALETWS